MIGTYPLKDEQSKGKNHWRILAEVEVILVLAIFLKVVCPSSPGSEDHHGTPDDHDNLDDDHGQSRESVETNTNRLTGVDPAVSHGPLYVKVSPDVDGCGDVSN